MPPESLNGVLNLIPFDLIVSYTYLLLLLLLFITYLYLLILILYLHVWFRIHNTVQNKLILF